MITRLEAATSRLEDIASTTLENQSVPNGIPPVAASAAAAVPPSQAQAQSAPKQAPPPPLPPSIEAFDDLINNEIKSFVDLSEAIGGLLAEQV